MPAFANGQSTLKTLTTKTTTAMTPNDNRSSLGASVYTSTASYHSTVLTHPVANLNATATTTTGATVSKAVNSIASIIISNFVPTLFPPTPPRSGNLVVASSGEDLSNFHDVTLDLFDEDDDLFGSPMVFDASDDGLWNGRFAPPPPRPPFFEDEPVLSDGLTTCDLCSWAMPTKSTFIFEGTIEKASELGWPLALIIVSILSALLGAIIMITVVRCKRKKSSNNRNETHVQWWSRNKRPNNNNNNNDNNNLRRSNIYTAHPADSIRGLHQPTLSASSSLTAMSAMGSAAVSAIQASAAVTPLAAAEQQQYHSQQQTQHIQQQFQAHSLMGHHQQLHQQQQQQQQHQVEYADYEPEYHQPQELQLQLQQLQQRQKGSPTMSSSSKTSSKSSSSLVASVISSPSLTANPTSTSLTFPSQQKQNNHHHHHHHHHHNHYHHQQQQQTHQQPKSSGNSIWLNGSALATAS